MNPINPKLLDRFIRVCERAAFGASKFRGKNDKVAADQAAVDEMRAELNKIEMKGNIVIGEGEMDEAPMLFIGEKLGTNVGEELDIAIDPLEGTNFTAKNLPNAFSVMAITKKGGLLSAPDTYMEKIAIGLHLPKNIIDLDNSVEKNIKLLAEAKNTTSEKIVALGYLNLEEAYQILNINPKTLPELRVFTSGWKKLIPTEDMEQILSIVEKVYE